MPARDGQALYDHRFSADERRVKQRLWRCLVDHFLNRFFGPDEVVIDLGSGFCEFINAVAGKKKYAYEIEPAFAQFAAPDVEFLTAAPGQPVPLADGTCDRVFACNFFEHLTSREEVLFIIREAFRLLTPGGLLVVIQPNIALLKGAYWDFFDHLIPLTDKSLTEAMALAGFRRRLLRRRFLPYTTKAAGARGALLLRLYLACPPLQWLYGRQSLIVAEKPDA